VNRRKVRVVQRRERARLSLESRQSFWICRICLRQHLDRDITTEPRIMRAIDLTHSAGAEGRHDLVRAEARSDGQSHVRSASSRGDSNENARGKRKEGLLGLASQLIARRRALRRSQSLAGVISRVDIRLCGSSGPVVLLRKGRLAKLREELVESIQFVGTGATAPAFSYLREIGTGCASWPGGNCEITGPR
jgi:hypothetical protein